MSQCRQSSGSGTGTSNWKIKDEICWRSFGFNLPTPRLLVSDQWGYPRTYVCWRLGWAVYHWMWCVTDFIDTAMHSQRPFTWLVYVTNWTYILLAFSAAANALIVVIVAFSSHAIRDGCTPRYLKALWLSYVIVSDGSLLVTILYFSLVYTGSLTTISGAKHVGNSVYVLLDLFVTATPIRLLHTVYPAVYTAGFMLFSLVYWALGGVNGEGLRYIYKALNWDDPQPTLINASAVLFLGVPLTHLAIWSLFKLRVALWVICCRDKHSETVACNVA